MKGWRIEESISLWNDHCNWDHPWDNRNHYYDVNEKWLYTKDPRLLRDYLNSHRLCYDLFMVQDTFHFRKLEQSWLSGYLVTIMPVYSYFYDG